LEQAKPSDLAYRLAQYDAILHAANCVSSVRYV
jgi:hypothetical protein